MSEEVVRPGDSRIAENRLICQATACVLQIEGGMNDRFWPLVSVKLSVNVPNLSVGFAPESGRSECAC